MKRYPPSTAGLPRIWLVSDARNDAELESILRRLPRGSGLIFRHYHLPPEQRRDRFDALRREARRSGHWLVLSEDAATARCWGADGAYGPAARLAHGPALPRLIIAHSLREIGQAKRADAVVLSPAFLTRSHPGGSALGPARFRLLAKQSPRAVIALGGMTPHRAALLKAAHWAAIDGLSPRTKRRIPKDS